MPSFLSSCNYDLPEIFKATPFRTWFKGYVIARDSVVAAKGKRVLLDIKTLEAVRQNLRNRREKAKRNLKKGDFVKQRLAKRERAPKH